MPERVDSIFDWLPSRERHPSPLVAASPFADGDDDGIFVREGDAVLTTTVFNAMHGVPTHAASAARGDGGAAGSAPLAFQRAGPRAEVNLKNRGARKEGA